MFLALRMLLAAALAAGKLGVKALIKRLKRNPRVWASSMNKLSTQIPILVKRNVNFAAKIKVWGPQFITKLKQGDIEAWMKILATAEGLSLVYDAFASDVSEEDFVINGEVVTHADDDEEDAASLREVVSNGGLVGSSVNQVGTQTSASTNFQAAYTFDQIQEMREDAHFMISQFGSSAAALRVYRIIAKGETYLLKAFVSTEIE